MKLLIIRAGALGDTLMLMPLIYALSGMHKVIVLGRRPGIEYLEPYIDQCMDIERGGWHRLFSTAQDIDIPHPRADHVIAFLYDKEKIVYQNLSRMFTGSKKDIFPPFPDPESKTHIVLYMAHALQSAGIPVDSRSILSNALKIPVMGSARGAGKKIIIHPGSGSKKKNYSPDFWSDLLAGIKKENPNPVPDICFLLGPAEEDIVPVIEKIARQYNAELYLCPDKKELLSILSSAYLYMGHDSGVTHLAAMLGINTIALFKDSSIDQWRPPGPSVKIIRKDSSEESVLNETLGEVSRFFNRTIKSSQ